MAIAFRNIWHFVPLPQHQQELFLKVRSDASGITPSLTTVGVRINTCIDSKTEFALVAFNSFSTLMSTANSAAVECKFIIDGKRYCSKNSNIAFPSNWFVFIYSMPSGNHFYERKPKSITSFPLMFTVFSIIYYN